MELGMFDTHREARFESMRKEWRSARVLRRHEDLRKQCEREVRGYDNAKRVLEVESRRAQRRYQERLKDLHHHCPSRSIQQDTGGVRTLATPSGPVSSREMKGNTCWCQGPLPESSTAEDPPKVAGHRFLFRVLRRNGKLVYIRDEMEALGTHSFKNCGDSTRRFAFQHDP
ncbi:uncharacterized protein LOC112573998 [Pomacea canaliculata]|nr:uncharacterized protein LOC112573998 [Pomacea canaliculata]